MQALKRSATTRLPVRSWARSSSTATGSKDQHPSGRQVDTARSSSADAASQVDQQTKKKTQAELDEEVRRKLSALGGDGGEAGIEYEDGKPTSMKRGVRENMFRYI